VREEVLYCSGIELGCYDEAERCSSIGMAFYFLVIVESCNRRERVSGEMPS